MRSLVLLWATAALLAACGSTGPLPGDAGSDTGTVAPQRTVRIVLVSTDVSTPVRVTPGQRVLFAVELVDAWGVPVADEVRLALQGAVGDASLSSSRVRTDTRGLSPSVTFVAPSSSAVLYVRASAAMAADARLDIGVGSQGFGTVSVTSRYSGSRSPTAMRVSLYDRDVCASADRVEPLRTSQLGTASGTVSFSGLPAGEVFYVRAEATGRNGVALATACAPDVRVTQDQTAAVSLTLFDRPLRVEGAYGVQLSFDLGALPARMASSWLAAGEAVVGPAGGDVAYVLAAVADAVEARAGSAARMAFESAVRDRLLDAVRADFARRSAAPIAILTRVASDAAGVLANATSDGTVVALASTDVQSSLRVVEWRYSLDPRTPDNPADDVVVTPDGSPCVNNPTCGEAIARDGDRTRVVLRGVAMPLAVLARRAVDVTIARAGASDTGQALRNQVSCAAIDLLVMGTTGSCVDRCVRDACDAALDRIGAAFDTAVVPSAAMRASIDLQFEAPARASAGTLDVTALDPSSYYGIYREDPMVAFSGVARFSLR